MSTFPPPEHGLSLPVGHTFKGYEIRDIISYDDFSVSYLAVNTRLNTEVILIEYLPCLIYKRNNQTYNLEPKKTEYTQKYKWGLKEFVYKNYDLMTIHHSNIINYEKCFKANNTAYLVTDHISYKNGVSLKEFINGKSFSEAEIKLFLTPLLDGLKLIHSRGYTHSHLTPSTIFINNTITDPLITHLADVKYIFRYYKKQQVPVVTAGFSPCEQYYTNEELGAWTDIYSIGSVLYWLIAGVIPVSAASRLAAMVDHQKDPLVPISILIKETEGGKQTNNQVYSNQLLSAIDHALELQGVDRPQSIDKWRRELDVSPLVVVNAEKVSTPKVKVLPSVKAKPLPLFQQSRKNNLSSTHKLKAKVVNVATEKKKLTSPEEADKTKAYLEKNIKRRDIDFNAISNVPFEGKKFIIKKNFWAFLALASVLMLLLGLGSFYFFYQPFGEQYATKNLEHQVNEPIKVEVLSKDKKISPQAASAPVEKQTSKNETDDGQLVEHVEFSLEEKEKRVEAKLFAPVSDENTTVMVVPTSIENKVSAEILGKDIAEVVSNTTEGELSTTVSGEETAVASTVTEGEASTQILGEDTAVVLTSIENKPVSPVDVSITSSKGKIVGVIPLKALEFEGVLTSLESSDAPLAKEELGILLPVINSAAEYSVIATLAGTLNKFVLFKNEPSGLYSQNYIIKRSRLAKVGYSSNESIEKNTIKKVFDLTLKKIIHSKKKKAQKRQERYYPNQKTREQYQREWQAKQDKIKQTNANSKSQLNLNVKKVWAKPKKQSGRNKKKVTQKRLLRKNDIQNIKARELKQRQLIQQRQKIEELQRKRQQQRDSHLNNQTGNDLLEDNDW